MREKQTEKILAYMRQHGSITPLEAILDLNCMRLASRISDLKKEGYVIRSEMASYTRTDGTKSHFKKYSIVE